MLPVLFTMPDASSTMASIGTWSTEGFTNFLPAIYIGVGLLIAGMVVSFVAKSVLAGAVKVVGRGRGGRRGGRRR